jgi:hypothetical protein
MVKHRATAEPARQAGLSRLEHNPVDEADDGDNGNRPTHRFGNPTARLVAVQDHQRRNRGESAGESPGLKT